MSGEILNNFLIESCKICVIEVNLLKYNFESHLIYKYRYYRQTIFNQLNIISPYVDMISLCHSVTILWEIYVMRLRFNLIECVIPNLIYFCIPEIFKTNVYNQFLSTEYPLNLCSRVVNSHRLSFNQKLVWNVVLKISGIHKWI